MSTASDARFWDRTSRKYAKAAISDQAGYERTLERTRALLGPDDRVLELGCGTGTTALRLAGDVQSYCATDISAEMIAIAEKKRLPGPARRLSSAPRPQRRLRLRTGSLMQFWGSTISIWSAICPARYAASMPCLQRRACSSPRHPASGI